ncbi:MAG: hypothetical protein M3R55_01385 [Acidobacteriota bacterium]|nr:hypothetical protein [Acidobacteriota bacterium]
MTARTFRRSAALVSLLVFAAAPGAGVARSQSPDKSIFVTVLDQSGAPVTGMTADEFALREGSQGQYTVREIVSVTQPSMQPMCVVLLADTTKGAEEYVPDIRNGFKGFIEQMHKGLPGTEISLWEFGQAAIRIKDFTADAEAISKDVARIFPKPNASSVLLEALYEASESLAKRPCQRRAIVALNLEPSDETSRQEPQKVTQSMVKSRAHLFVLSVQKGGLKNPQRDVVFTNLVRNGGGLREFIVAESAIETQLRRFASALTSQYEITYKRPSGKPQIVQTGSTRPNIRLIAGIIAPQ